MIFFIKPSKSFKPKTDFDLSLVNYTSFFMGEAKRRKELGLPPREKPVELKLPKLDKKNIQKQVRSFLYKNPIVPFVFYGLVLGTFGWGLFNLVKGYQLIKS
tara:strand:- start:195 stop:500 length:306 start_codon:yes stop_codon:yes gene_type:complete